VWTIEEARAQPSHRSSWPPRTPHQYGLDPRITGAEQ
jgi:hypothetical protein